MRTKHNTQQIQMNQCPCAGPLGWTNQPEKSHACSLREQVPGVPGGEFHQPQGKEKGCEACAPQPQFLRKLGEATLLWRWKPWVRFDMNWWSGWWSCRVLSRRFGSVRFSVSVSVSFSTVPSPNNNLWLPLRDSSVLLSLSPSCQLYIVFMLASTGTQPFSVSSTLQWCHVALL